MNARKIVEHARKYKKSVRIASKSIRSIPILERLLTRYPDVINGIMAFSATEACWLSNRNICNDILIGYPIWHVTDIEEVYHCIQSKNIDHVDNSPNYITLTVDCIQHVQHLDSIIDRLNAIAKHKTKIPVCIDFDLSYSVQIINLWFGVRRSPLRTINDVEKVLQHVIQSSNLKLDGLLGYEAQIAGLGDNHQCFLQKPMDTLIRTLKHYSSLDVLSRRKSIVEHTKKILKSNGFTLRFVNGGGTGSINFTCTDLSVNEITVGSGLFSPLLFDEYKDLKPFHPSLFFACQIIRQPTLCIYTCLGGGYSASGKTGQDKSPQPYLLQGAQLDPNEGAGEVQTPVWCKKKQLQLGDAIFFRHAKAGEICERFNDIYVIKQGKFLQDRYKTYRGEGMCFL
ncbi:unnamed protein product [Didymodactylos carnosus]|uniref:Alanine racemase N-terminal domain-containing protein n=1 Tax=Didymodactylos carnosus TaxID=1234261 RepID=A0A815ZB32_9BILA|nr:unnamed protein product [Didymodactylos carnosus]CAF4447336.1 unnamed protein product [Didymodactylos carnosus]